MFSTVWYICSQIALAVGFLLVVDMYILKQTSCSCAEPFFIKNTGPYRRYYS